MQLTVRRRNIHGLREAMSSLRRRISQNESEDLLPVRLHKERSLLPW